MQISHVVPTGTREKIVYASFSSLALWPKFKTLLKRTCAFHSMALMTIKKKLCEFAKWILSIRNGEYLTSHS